MKKQPFEEHFRDFLEIAQVGQSTSDNDVLLCFPKAQLRNFLKKFLEQTFDVYESADPYKKHPTRRVIVENHDQ